MPTDAAQTPPPRVRPAALSAVLVVGLALAAIIIGASSWLDGDAGSSAGADKAQPIVAGAVVAPGQELTGGGAALPALALIAAEPVPQAIAQLPAVQQAARYAAMAGNDPRLLVKLGAASQRAGDPDAADAAYDKALAADPASLEARIGKAMVQGSRGGDGLTAAAAALAVITSEHPRSQVAWFNRGWVDAYRKDAAGTVTALQKVVDLNPRTSLGTTAAGLLTRIARAKSKGTRSG